jgi:hypothetical protein
MMHFGFSPTPIFSLGAGFHSCTQASIRLNSKRIRPNGFFVGFWLALVGLLDIQSIQMSLHESGFDLARRLKFQVARLPS